MCIRDRFFCYRKRGRTGRAGRMVVPGGGAVSGAAESLITSVFAGAVIVILLVSAIIGIFISPLFDVGTRRFYMESRLAGRSVGIDRILWGFSNGYLKIVKTQFLKNLIPAAVKMCIRDSLWIMLPEQGEPHPEAGSRGQPLFPEESGPVPAGKYGCAHPG